MVNDLRKRVSKYFLTKFSSLPLMDRAVIEKLDSWL